MDGYGFKRDEKFDHKRYENFMSEYLPVMTHRAQRWTSVVGDGDKINKSRTGRHRRSAPVSVVTDKVECSRACVHHQCLRSLTSMWTYVLPCSFSLFGNSNQHLYVCANLCHCD